MNHLVEQMPAPDVAWHQKVSMKAAGAILAASGLLLTGCADEREPLTPAATTASAECGSVEFTQKSDAEGHFGYKVTPHNVTDNAELLTYGIAWDTSNENGERTIVAVNAAEGTEGDPYFHAYKKPGEYTIQVAGLFRDLTKKEKPHETDPDELRKTRFQRDCATKTVTITKAQIAKAKEIRDSPYKWPDVDQNWG